MAIKMHMMLAVMMVLITRSSAQSWPVKPVDSAKEQSAEKVLQLIAEGRLNMFQEYFFIGPNAAPDAIFNQLYITAEEARLACQAAKAYDLIKTEGAKAAHPRTCFAYIVCQGEPFSVFSKRTTFLYWPQIRIVSAGTYFDPVTGGIALWTPDNNCASDPCKTKKGMSDGRTCNGYVRCAGADTDGNSVYTTGTCPDGFAFDPITDSCQLFNGCPASSPDTTTLYCNATGRPENPPAGIPDNGFFNRTYRDNDLNQIFTRAEVCPASSVFDPNDVRSTQLCQCIVQTQDACLSPMIDVGKGGSKSWAGVVDENLYQFAVEASGQFQGWARFVGDGAQSFSYYDAQALSSNQLTGDWTLTFRYRLEGAVGQNQLPLILAENRNAADGACPSPTISIVLQTSTTLRATITTISSSSSTVSVDVNSISNLTDRSVSVKLQRVGNSLTLEVIPDGNPQGQSNTVQGLGSQPMASTKCGLVFGQYYAGLLENVKLTRESC